MPDVGPIACITQKKSEMIYHWQGYTGGGGYLKSLHEEEEVNKKKFLLAGFGYIYDTRM